MGKINEHNTNISNVRARTDAGTEARAETQPTVRRDAAENAGQDSKTGEFRNLGAQNKISLGSGSTPAADAPSDITKEASISSVGGKIIIDAGAGDDRIGVSQNAGTGDITVSVNGATRTFTGADRDNLVIRAGDGNDRVTVGRGVTVQLTLEGGAGNDRIEVNENVATGQKIFGGAGDDRIQGGIGGDKIEADAGNDTVDGGAGDDYINGSLGNDRLTGSAGSDVIYGGDGRDTISGNAGTDYLEGGRGNDEISGGGDADVVSGGTGDDRLRGGAGNDRIYAGRGTDRIYGDSGSNTIYNQTGDTVEDSRAAQVRGRVRNTVVTVELIGNPGGTGVRVEGTPEFKERVEQDLEMMRSSPVGREMLGSFDRAYADTRSPLAGMPLVGGAFEQGIVVTIREHNADSGSAGWENIASPSLPQPNLNPATGTRGTPQDANINYKPSYMPVYTYPDGNVESVPSVVLFHEMAHANDYVRGTFNPNDYNGADPIDSAGTLRSGERVAVGLPIDHDGNSSTPEQTDAGNHSDNLTENALRLEMNLRRRNHYSGGKIIR